MTFGVSTEVRREIRAGGGVVWRPGPAGTEIAIVHRPRHQDWTLPKGKLEPGEHELAGACREVWEETGFEVAPQHHLTQVRYLVPTRDGGAADKVVDYWAMRYLADDRPFVANDEIDGLRWVPLDRAGALLTYPRDADVVAGFAARPLATGVVLLVRHGSAGEREDWDGPDVTRPLDPIGERQAAALADLLALFRPGRIISATPRRCVQTVEPLAARLGLTIGSDSVFDEESHARAPEIPAARLREFVATGTTTVVCSQRAVIPDTVALTADVDGIPLPSVATAKGDFWVLAYHTTSLITADQVTNPVRPR